MKAVFSVLPVTLLCACATTHTAMQDSPPVSGRDFVFTFRDFPEARKFEVTLESLSEREICVPMWPEENGWMHVAAFRRVLIRAGGTEFSFKDPPTDDYCIGKACANPIGFGDSLQSNLMYASFGLPSDRFDTAKELIFELVPYWCDTMYR